MGNVTSAGVRKQLGRPNLDPLSLLIRETVQNSWDARTGRGPVKWELAGRDFKGSELDALRHHVFSHVPGNLGLEKLWEPNANFLTISDRRTTGLTGAVRADQVGADEKERDFVDFVLNVGQVKNTELAGGTYGYGKSILYLISRVSTVIIYSRTMFQGRRVTRLIAAALGPQYEHFTGRHWWGNTVSPDILEPLEGKEADEIARAVGFPAFENQETGTAVMIPLPDFGSSTGGDEEGVPRSGAEALIFAAASLVWNFWPKMIPRESGHPDMLFAISWQGKPIEMPDPNADPTFLGLVTALKNARRGREESSFRFDEENRALQDVVCQRPKQHLGIVSLLRLPDGFFKPGSSKENNGLFQKAFWQLAPFHDRCAHVALMRDAELVVKYISGKPCQKGHYTGVFVVDGDAKIDRAFADSEPPSHDEWQTSGLSRPAQTYVNVALRRIRETLDIFAAGPENKSGTVAAVSLGGVSDMLANLVPVVGSTGVAVRMATERELKKPPVTNMEKVTRRPRSSTAVKAPARVELLDDGALEELDGQPVLKVCFRVHPEAGSSYTKVAALVGVGVIDATTIESEAPVGAVVPKVHKWVGPDGRSHGGRSVSIPSTAADGWTVFVTVPPDTVIRASIVPEMA